MDEITLDDQTYVSSKRAAQITGYAKDYVGQLCREGRVEARLVGRNWYVLEASIRAHRFGSEIVANKAETSSISANTAPTQAWKPTNYSSEPSPNLLPTLAPHEIELEKPVLDQKPQPAAFEKPVATPVSSQVVKEMQSAWHDWFAKTNELEVSREILLEDPSFQETEANDSPEEKTTLHKAPIESSQETVNVESEAEVTPITLEKVAEAIERRSHVVDLGEETVPIHRTFAAQSVIQPQTRLNNPDNRPDLQPQGRILRERRVTRRKKPSKLIQGLFVVIALLVISISVIGTGVLDTYIAKYNLDFRPVKFLGGESSFQK